MWIAGVELFTFSRIECTAIIRKISATWSRWLDLHGIAIGEVSGRRQVDQLSRCSKALHGSLVAVPSALQRPDWIPVDQAHRVHRFVLVNERQSQLTVLVAIDVNLEVPVRRRDLHIERVGLLVPVVLDRKVTDIGA
jgi:hypothetical protein